MADITILQITDDPNTTQLQISIPIPATTRVVNANATVLQNQLNSLDQQIATLQQKRDDIADLLAQVQTKLSDPTIAQQINDARTTKQSVAPESKG